MRPKAPWYGTGSLADLVPSALARIGDPETQDVFGLPETERICVLLVDGLGWRLLREHAREAPFLAGLEGEPITAGFPSTTATSLACVGTGRPPGEHGIVGYSFALDTRAGSGESPELLYPLAWQDEPNPEQLQPLPTMFERTAVATHMLAPHDLLGTGLSRAGLRGAVDQGVHALGDLAARCGEVLERPGLCYAYHADLDRLGHLEGPGGSAWRAQLSQVDRLAANIAERLPAGALLLVTADHGMVWPDDSVDYDTRPELRAGVRAIAGEPRMRHLYPKPGAEAEVLATWRAELGERAWVVTGDEAIEAGWFGPRVDDRVRARIGSVLVAAREDFAVRRTVAEPVLSGLPGQHGSLTDAELLVPLLRCLA